MKKIIKTLSVWTLWISICILLVWGIVEISTFEKERRCYVIKYKQEFVRKVDFGMTMYLTNLSLNITQEINIVQNIKTDHNDPHKRQHLTS